MKKLFFTFITVCACLCMPTTLSAQSSGLGGGGSTGGGGGTGGTGGGPGGSNGGIIISPVPPRPPHKPYDRSANLEVRVDASIDYDFGQIIVSFVSGFGEATVTIENQMGQTVAAYTCDMSAEGEVWLPIPNTAGHYTLIINSAKFAGIGEFDIY